MPPQTKTILTRFLREFTVLCLLTRQNVELHFVFFPGILATNHHVIESISNALVSNKPQIRCLEVSQCGAPAKTIFSAFAKYGNTDVSEMDLFWDNEETLIMWIL